MSFLAAVRADKTRMLRPGQAIALCVLALLTIGVVMVNSAGMSVDPRNAVTIESILLSRSTIYMGLAVLAMMGVGLLPIRGMVARFVERPALAAEPSDGPEAPARLSLDGLVGHLLGLWPLWTAVIVLIGAMATVYLPGVGKEVNNSHRWINLHVPGLDSIQPSELAKWGLIAVMAWYCCRNARRMHSFWYGLLPGLAAAGAVAAFIVLEDLGTGALVGMVACIILLAAGARIWQLALLAPIPLAGLAAAIITNPYRIHRITSFLDPYQDAQGKGYHMIQSMVAVANGQFFGRGLGNGLQKFGYLPEDTTDFLFAIICEELGVFGAGLVIFLYGLMLWMILTVIRREPSRFLKLIALGVMATVGLQALINLAVVTGLGPTKGIALPLLSSGGTGWILTAASLGLVIAMDRTQGVMQWYRTGSEAMSEETIAAETPDLEPVVVRTPAPAVAGVGTPIFALDDERFAPPAFSAAAIAMPDAGTAPIGQTGLLFADPPLAPPAAATPPAPPTADSIAPELAAPIVQPSEPRPEPFGLLPPPPTQSSTVVVTDDAREWPDMTRLRPA